MGSRTPTSGSSEDRAMNRTAFALTLALLLPVTAHPQQPATGFPPYGSFADGGFDALNRQNLNVHFAIPVAASPGRGMNLSLNLVYDSLVWQNYGSSWQPTIDASGSPIWGWKKVSPGGSIAYKTFRTTCLNDAGNPISTTEWGSYSYTDPAGTKHNFLGVFTNVCVSYPTGYASDGSGYYIDINSPDSPLVRSPAGIKIGKDGTT